MLNNIERQCLAWLCKDNNGYSSWGGRIAQWIRDCLWGSDKGMFYMGNVRRFSLDLEIASLITHK